MINCGSPEKLKDYLRFRYTVWLFAPQTAVIFRKVDIARLRDKSGLRQRADDGYNKGADGRGKSGIAKEYRRTEMRKTVVEHSEKLIRKRAAELAAEKSRG